MDKRVYQLREERRRYRQRLKELERMPASTPTAEDARSSELRMTQRQLEIVEQVILRAQRGWLREFRAQGSISPLRSACLQEDGLLIRFADSPSIDLTDKGERLLSDL